MASTSKFCAGAGLMLALVQCASATRAEPAPASAAPPTAAAGDTTHGRFVMTPVAEGFLRLDTQSGQVSLCTLSSGQAQCRASADERAALEAEIDRLAKENAALKGQKPQEFKTIGPNMAEEDEDRRFDRALNRAERFMRRMMQIFRESSGKPPPASL